MKALFYLNKRWFSSGSVKRSLRVMRLLVMSGIALSVAAWLLTQGVISGFHQKYSKALLEFNAHLIAIKNLDRSISFDEKKLPASVLAHTDFLNQEALLIYKADIEGVLIKGINLKTFNQVHSDAGFDISLFKASPKNLPRQEIVLGRGLAEKLGIKELPAKIKILIPESSGREIGRVETLEVVGFFKVGLYEYDSHFAYMSLASLRMLTGNPMALTGWEMKLEDPHKAAEVSFDLESIFPPSVSLITWQELHHDIYEALNLEKRMFQWLMGALIGLSLLNLVSVILLNIYLRKKEVAILRALGLSLIKIRLLFSIHGFLMGLASGLIGCLIAFALFCLIRYANLVPIDPEVYFIDHLPILFSHWLSLAVVIGTASLSALVGWSSGSFSKKVAIREGLHEPG